MKKLLGIFAHPDDESVAPGGTLAKYSKAGWRVDIVTATRGDAGGWGDVDEASGRTLPEVRTEEVRKAAEHLGVRSVTLLDYKDGRLSIMHPGEIEAKIVAVLEEMKPDVVITHEPNGITNHPDHIKTSLSTTFAYQTYAKEREKEGPPEDPNPPKLYYVCFPETVLSYLIQSKRFPRELFHKPVRGVEDKKITTVIDIRRFATSKMKALEAHVTQRPILEKYMNVANNPFLLQEYFVLRMVGVREVFMGKNDKVSDRL